MADEQVVGMNYFDHQFLRREDFSTAQQYHVDRLRQHNQLLHQAGIIDGLEVTRTSPRSIQVTPGRAVDQAHREVVLRPTAAPEVPLLLRIQTIEGVQETEMHLTGAALPIPLDQVPPSSEPGNPVLLTIQQGLKETTASADPGITGNTRLVERAIIEASTAPLSGAQLLLAQINRNLDGTIAGDPHLTGRQQATARLGDDAITSAKVAAADGTTEQDTSTGTGIKTAHIQDQAVTSTKIPANTIQLDHLEESLRQSIGLGPRWVRLPFLPKQIGNLPPFNLGLTHSNSAGAARGIMEIPVPAGATQITQLRIAGTENADKITIRLWRAKLDSGDRLLENTFVGAPFNHLFPSINAPLHSELEGLALEVETTGRSDIWFVGAEFR